MVGGRKISLKNASDTKTIQSIKNFSRAILDYAHKLDESEVIDKYMKAKMKLAAPAFVLSPRLELVSAD